MPLSRSASSFFDRLFWRPAIRFLVPLSRSAASYSDRLFWRPAIRFSVPLSRSASPFFWPVILTPGYPVSKFLSPAPPRLILTGYFDARLSGFRCLSSAPQRLLLTGYFTARLSGFRCPSPAPPRLFLTGYFDAQVSLFRYPRAFFSLPVLVALIVFFDALLFPTQPSLPGYLGGRLALWAALRLACGFYRSAVFTALRFLPLHGFYRSAVFTAPRFFPLRFRQFFSGALLFRRPRACCPPVFHHFRAARSWCRLAVRLRFLPPRGFSRSAVFTAPRFLPLRGFYRSAFTGSLGGFALPPPSCLLPPSLHPLPGGSLFGPPCGTPAIFTAPRFLPLRGFYRSAVFTAPRFLPLRGFFYCSAVFTAPRFLPLRFRWFFGGLCSSLLPPSLRPLPGAPCATGSSVASPVGRHSWSSFCTTYLTALGALPLISPVSLLCISYTLGDHRSSRLLNDGTRAPRVLPPPSWDLSAIGN